MDFDNYLNQWYTQRCACNPMPCEWDEGRITPSPFHYEDAAKTILTGADEDFLVGEVTLASSVKKIKQYAFYEHTSNDWSVVIPDSVETIEEAAFRNSRLQNVTFGTGLKTIGDYAFAYNNYCTFNQLPNTVESIGTYAFASCQLQNSQFTIPGNVTFIGEMMFGGDNYYHPSSLIISTGVTKIDDGAFKELVVDSIALPSSLLTIGNSTFKSASCGNLIIPDSVTTIGEEAFMYYKGTSVTLPASLTTIAAQLFFNSNITSIVIPDTVISIGDSAFGACRNLTSITIPSSVTSIGDYAFMSCTGLTSITIPDGVTSIGSDAFAGCTFTKANFINNSSATGYPWGATITE